MTGAEPTVLAEDLWSVFDFVRRYRLDKQEENRLLSLFGPFAAPQELLRNARRYSRFG